MTSSAIFDGLETGLERYDWKPNTQRQKREKIYLHYNPRSKSNWKEKVQENKNQNIEPFIRKIWLIFIDVILEQITAFSLTLTALPPIIFKRKPRSFNYRSFNSRSVKSC